jgi:hypothetical protein
MTTHTPYPTLEFQATVSLKEYVGIDRRSGLEYKIEAVPYDKGKFRLTYIDTTQVNDRGNHVIEHLGGVFSRWSDAAQAARDHLDTLREDEAERTVVEYVHPDDSESVLSVFTNGYTRMTEIILNDADGTSRIVIDRDQAEALQAALGQALTAQQEARLPIKL